MFCPQCRYEYREGFSQCADCGVALVSELPPERIHEEEQEEQDYIPDKESEEDYEFECVRCGAAVPPDAKVCPECGDNLEQVVGMENSPDSGGESEPEESAEPDETDESFLCAECGREISEDDNHVMSKATRQKYADLDTLLEAEGSEDWLPVCADCFRHATSAPSKNESREEDDHASQAASRLPTCPRCHSGNTKELLNTGIIGSLFSTGTGGRKFKCTSCRYEW